MPTNNLLTHCSPSDIFLYMDMQTNFSHSRPIRVRVAAGGRVVIPADIRQSLGVKEGDELLIVRDGDGIRMTTVLQTAKEVQSFFAKFKKPGEGVVDEFLAGRRAEALKEDGESGTRRARK